MINYNIRWGCEWECMPQPLSQRTGIGKSRMFAAFLGKAHFTQWSAFIRKGHSSWACRFMEAQLGTRVPSSGHFFSFGFKLTNRNINGSFFTSTGLKAQTGILWLKSESRAKLCSELQEASRLEEVPTEAALGALAQWPQWHFWPHSQGLLSAPSYLTVLYSTRCIFTLGGHPNSLLYFNQNPIWLERPIPSSD